MYERIVVPVDGSPFAESVIPYARGLAEALGARIRLVRIAHEDDMDAAHLYARAVASRLGVEGEAIQSARLGVGHDLIEVMKDRPADLLAMTTHGRGGLLETFLGSVATHVVRESPQPVLLYRPHEEVGLDEVREVRNIIVPLDGSDFSERVLPGAGRLAQAIGAGVTLVQVLEPASGHTGEVGPIAARGMARHYETGGGGPPPGDVIETAYLQSAALRMHSEHAVKPEWEVLRGKPGKALTDYARDQGPNSLVMMSSHGRAAVQKTVMGSVASECVRRSGAPVLVYGPSVPE